MKKIFLLFAVCAMVFSCASNYSVDGTIDESAAITEGSSAILIDQVAGSVDTCLISDGKFHFEGAADPTNCLAIVIMDKESQERYHHYISFVPERGNIQINVGGEEVVVKGKAVNDAYNSLQEEMSRLAELYFDEDMRQEKGLSEEDVDRQIKELAVATFNANKDNYAGLAGLNEIVYDLSAEELESMLQDAPEFITENRTVKTVRAAKVREAATAEGSMFVDFEGKNPEGEVARLSDFVGRGKYVLVDFWASWCGPCKAEIPVIKEIYEQYNGDKFTVVGVAVWDRDNSGSRIVMEQLGMNWSQIFVGTDKTATELYGIVGIPHIILFGPDGTIVKRNLRGEAMKEAVRNAVASE